MKPPKLFPFDSGCLLDDPLSCEAEPTEHTPPPAGGAGQGGSIGSDSYCDAYRDALGDMPGTPFGMKQLEALGC